MINARKLPDLNLVQNTAISGSTDSHTWYGWSLTGGMTDWSPYPTGDGPPKYCCDVSMPSFLWGSGEEIRADVRLALHAHAWSCGVL